jgi:hypothetical protein
MKYLVQKGTIPTLLNIRETSKILICIQLYWNVAIDVTDNRNHVDFEPKYTARRVKSTTNSMEHNPLRDANSHSESQEIPRFLYNPKIHYPAYESPLLKQMATYEHYHLLPRAF